MNEHFELLTRQPDALTGAIMELVAADLAGNPSERADALLKQQDILADSMTIADMLGRRRTLLEADRMARNMPPPSQAEPLLFAAHTRTPAVANVSFTEAVDDILRREPRLAETAEEVAYIYNTQHALTAVHLADMSTARKLRDTLARFAEAGVGEPTAKAVLASMFDWAESYSQTVYRTNMATAWSAGRFKAATHPDVARVIGAFEYVAVGDRDTRPNHLAAKGIIASQFDPIWDVFTPPLGYNCRCGLRMVSRFTLKRRGLLEGNRVKRYPETIPHGAHPDPGFGMKRPDRAIYGR